MGMSVSFDRELAIKAGIEFKTIPNNGTFDEGDDLDYIAWCQESQECIKVPNTDHYVSDDGVGTKIVVTANKWGRTYYPLTAWLTKHNIEWSEFS